MDPIVVTVVTALATGAAAATNVIASTAVMDAYAALKRVIVDRYKNAGPFVEPVESDPSSKPQRQALAKQLEQAGAGGDDDLKAVAQALLSAIDELRNEPKAVALFNFSRLRAAKNFELTDIDLEGPLIIADEATFEGDFLVRGIHQKRRDGTAEKN